MFRMAKGDTEAVLVIAVASRDRHDWSLELPVVADGYEFTLTVDDQGEPFTTVGVEGIPSFSWFAEDASWDGPCPR